MKERTVMNYVAATLSIAIAIGPASALDVGVGGNVGGVGAGAGVGVGGGGASVGGGASAPGVGGANVGASAGTGTGAPSASVGARGNVNGVGGAGASVGTGKSASDGGTSGAAPAGTAGGSTGGRQAVRLDAGSASGSTGGSIAGSTTNNSGASVGIGQSQNTRNPNVALPGTLTPNFRIVILPRSLGPSGRDTSARGTWGYPLLPKLTQRPGTPNAVVRVCEQAIFSAAKPLGAVGVQAVSAGPVRRQRNGLTAPLSVRINYAKEVRQAKVGCRLDGAGTVIGVR